MYTWHWFSSQLPGGRIRRQPDHRHRPHPGKGGEVHAASGVDAIGASVGRPAGGAELGGRPAAPVYGHSPPLSAKQRRRHPHRRGMEQAVKVF